MERRVNHPRPASCQPLYSPLPGGRNFSRRGGTAEKAVEVGRRTAAQDCAIASRTHGRQVGRLDAWGAMPYPIDAEVLAKQRAGGEPMADLCVRHPCVAQLTTRHNTVRSAGEPANQLIRRGP